MSGRRWAIDLSPLRTSRDFRISLGAQSVSYFGSFVTYVAVPLQVARLTASPVAVGLLGLCELTPLLVTTLIGGAVAARPRRRRTRPGRPYRHSIDLGAVRGCCDNPVRSHPASRVCFLLVAALAQSARATHS